MAKLYFKVSSDYQEVIRLRNEIAKLDTQIKSMDVNKAPQAVAVLNNQMQQAKQQMRGMVEEAAVAGAVMQNDFKQKIYQGSQAVNDFTQKIIIQKTVVKDIEADVRRLSDAYKKVRNNPLQANSALGELDATKKELQKEKSTLFGLQTEQSNARLSVKKLRDEYSLYKDDAKNVVNANGGMSMSFGKMLGVIGGVAALKQLGSELIHVKGQFESIEIALDTMLGSKEKADALLAEVKSYATVSPLTLTDISSATQMMLGFNIEAEKVPTYFKAIGDISMGDTQKFNSLTLAFSQMSATGKLMGQDLNQMINAGFNPLQVIAQKTGKSIAELKDEMSKGAVSSEMVQQAFIDATSAGGKFYKMSENASKTINGQLSMMQDALDRVFNEIGTDGEGVIMGTIKGTTSLIQNYETVGKVLTGLIATYGAYRVALALTVLEDGKYVISLARLGTVLKSSAVAQSLLNSAILKNPYVAAAVLIGTLVTAIWAFHDATTAQEKELKRISEGTEQYNQYLEDEKNKINELIAKLQDETLTRQDKLEAFKELQKIAPKIFSEYKTEQDLIDHLTEARKKENEQILIRQKLMGSYNMNQSAERLKELKRLQELQKVGGAGRVRQGTQAEYESLYAQFNIKQDKGWLDTDTEVIEGKIKALTSSIGNAQKDMRVSQQNAWELTLDAMSKSTAKAQKTMYEGYRIILRDSGKQWIKIQGEEAPIDQETITNRITLLDQKVLSVEEKNANQFRNEAKKAWENAKKEVESVKTSSTSYKSAAQYEKALKEAQDKEETSEKAYKDLGGQTGSKANKAQTDANKDKVEAAERLKQIEENKAKLKEAYTRSESELTQSIIDGMADGYDKQKAKIDLDYKNKLAEIKEKGAELIAEQQKNERLEWENANPNWKLKGKIFTPKTTSVSQLSDVGKKQLSNLSTIAINEKSNAESALLKSLTDKYQSYADKRLAIEKKFNDDIKALQDQRDKAQTKGDTTQAEALDRSIAQATTEKGKNLMSLDFEKLKESPDYVRAFENLKQTSTETLNSLLSQFENAKQTAAETLDPEQLKEYATTIESIMDELESRNPFEMLAQRKQELAEGENQLMEAQKNLDDVKSGKKVVAGTSYNQKTGKIDKTYLTEEKALSKLNKAKDEVIQKDAKVTKAEKKVTEQISDLSTSLTDVGSAIGGTAGEIISLVGNIGSFAMSAMDGIKTVSNTTAQSVSTIEKASVILAIISTAIQLATKVAELISGKSKEQADTEKLQGVTEKISQIQDTINSLIEKRIDLINAATNAEKGYLASLTQTSIDVQKKYYEQQFESLLGNDFLAKKGKNNNLSLSELGISSIEELKEFMSSNDLLDYLNNGFGIRNLDDWQELIDAWDNLSDKEEEVSNALSESSTGLSFDDAEDAWDDFLLSADTTEQTVADNFEDYMKKAILNVVKTNYMADALKGWYDDFTAAMGDDVLSDDEVKKLQEEYSGIYDTAQEKINDMLEAAGLSLDSSSSQSSTSGGYETISQDTGEEVSGRLAAVQITGEELKAQSVLQSQSLNMLTIKAEEYLTVSKDSKDIADETRTILANSYLELQEIRENTGSTVKELKSVNERLGKIESNTKGLVSR